METLLLDNSANGKNIDAIPEVIAEYFEGKFDFERLKIQLLMLPDAITTAFAGTAVKVKKVTNVRTIGDSLSQSTMLRSMLGEVDKLLRAYLTFPVTSATAERSFSALRKLKTFLRSSMTQQHLNNLFLMYVHTTRTDELDLSSVANEFVSSNTRRINYFGKF